MSPVITLTTDFGAGDAYVASVRGVILDINPKVPIVDICHSIEPQNVLQAAFILSTAHHYFPKGTIHIAIVDPGVGSQRQAIILKTPSAFFIAPDNGILSYILDELCTTPARQHPSTPTVLEQKELGENLEAIAITNQDYWRRPVSTTFHGRDIFAPIAAHLSLGIPSQKLGESINHLHAFPIPKPYHDTKEKLVGQILHIDNFGNLITNIRNSELPDDNVIIEISNQCIHGLSQFYSQGDGLAAITGSNGYLEISLRNGSAATFLDSRVGDKIRLGRS